MKNNSDKAAVMILLDELKTCQELGKWKKFINALSANGNMKKRLSILH
jgi:hypothetical protein